MANQCFTANNNSNSNPKAQAMIPRPQEQETPRRFTSSAWFNKSQDFIPSLPENFAFNDISINCEDNLATSALSSYPDFDHSDNSLRSSATSSMLSSTGSSSSEDQHQCFFSSPAVKEFVLVPTDLDVLLGRGGKTNNHPGNKRYREEVLTVKPMYHDCTTKPEKKNVSELLMAYVHHYGGRFLSKDCRTGHWYIACPKTARKKCSQALREEKGRRRNSIAAILKKDLEHG